MKRFCLNWLKNNPLIRTFLYVSFFLTLLSSCKQWSHDDAQLKEGDVVLAEVKDRRLLKSDIENLIQDGSDPEDSIRVLKGLVNNWIKDQLMILEAEKNMPKDININKMIEDYKASLMLYNYETKLSAELLDTLVTDNQKKAYFDAHASEYILSESIGKYLVVKLKANTKGADNFFDHFKKNNFSEIETFATANAEYHDLNSQTWRPINQMNSFIPGNMITDSNLAKDKSYRKKEGNYEYFVKIIDFHKKGTQPPFDYIESKIVKILLNERKSNLIKQKKQQLFDKEAGSSKVKVYIDK